MKKAILCILDGWGYSSSHKHNAIYKAYTPNIDKITANIAPSLIHTDGIHVGLPAGQMGNSEVGHMIMGAGRMLKQGLLRINEKIAEGEFAKNPAIQDMVRALRSNHRSCHLVGLISDGAVHAHIKHIIHLAHFLMDQGIDVKLHAITDGRDTLPQSALQYINQLSDIHIATITGRFYAMDRDKRWSRTQLAYNAIVSAESSNYYIDAELAIKESYLRGENDEFIAPQVHKDYQGIIEGDAVVFCNYRADRMRQLASSMVETDFQSFKRSRFTEKIYTASFTSYAKELDNHIKVIFPAPSISMNLGETIASHGLKQLRIAETEKYAHVTYFFNSGNEQNYQGENRILVNSPKVDTYDQCPEMSAYKVTEELEKIIKQNNYDFICVNYANADMVGHTGNIQAAIQACEVLDECIGRILAAADDYNLLITADHGNAELMFNEQYNQPHTTHTTNLVPLMYRGAQGAGLQNGSLVDIAPTILNLLGIPQPQEMTGKVLINF